VRYLTRVSRCEARNAEKKRHAKTARKAPPYRGFDTLYLCDERRGAQTALSYAGF